MVSASPLLSANTGGNAHGSSRFGCSSRPAHFALAACGDGDDALLGTLERDRLELVAEDQQTILEVAVREGEAVEAGELLLRLDPATAAARLEQARANATRRRAPPCRGRGRRAQGTGERGARGGAGAAARADAESKEFDRVEKLVADKLVPANLLDRQRALRDSAIAESTPRATGSRSA